jgi:hypothetical protein
MEIPVRMLKNTTVFGKKDSCIDMQEHEIKPVMVSSYNMQPMTEKSHVTMINNTNDWQTTCQLRNQCLTNTTEHHLKHWFTIVQLDECLWRKCIKDNFSCIISKVDPFLRVVVIKCRKQQIGTSLTTPIKRIICLPEHVDCCSVNVSICQQRMVIIVKAPIRYTPEQECESGFCSELEPTLYKVLKHLHRNCPRFMVPRYTRDVQTGLHKIYLDVHCSGFQPEMMKISLNSLENVLKFKADREIFLNEHQMQHGLGFVSRTLRHEMHIPSWIHMDQITWCTLNHDTLRVHLPITKLHNSEDMYCMKKQCFGRC